MAETRRYADRREYLIQAVQKRRKTIRQKAIAFLGDDASDVDMIGVLKR